MDRYCLIQVLLVVISFGTLNAQVNTRNYYVDSPVHFPQDHIQQPPDLVNRFIGPQPALPPVRARQRPNCAQFSGDFSAPCVEDLDYNDNVKNLVNRLLLQSNSINEIVTDPMLKIILNDSLTPVPDIGSPSTRFGGFRETPVCAAREELIYPQRAKTPKDDWVFVVNQDSLRQALRVEKCFSESQPCDLGTVRSSDVTTVCRQKYVYRRMLAVGSNNIQPEEVLMPSCCVCYSRRNNFDIGTRFGTENGTVQPNTEGRTPVAGNVETINFNPPMTSAVHHDISFQGQPQGHQGHQIQHNRPVRNQQQNPFLNMYFHMDGGRR